MINLDVVIFKIVVFFVGDILDIVMRDSVFILKIKDLYQF